MATSRSPVLIVAAILASGLVGTQVAACGAGSAPLPAPSASGAASAEEQCLAVANAKHERRSGEPDTIAVSHILVKHADSKSPKAGVTRTRGEACLRAQEAQKALQGGADFKKLVGDYSDSPGVSGDGALGSVHRSDLEPAFADAAFQLDRGQMSDVVETAFGFHVVVRTE